MVFVFALGAWSACSTEMHPGATGGDAFGDGAALPADDAAVAAPADGGVPGADLATRAAPPDLATRPGTFLAVGYGGRRILSSDNGLTWTNDVADVPGDNADDQYLIRDVGWGGGVWITAGGFNGWTWRSSDGKSWGGKNDISQWFGGIAYGNGVWVAAGGTGRRSASSDGVTWKDSYDSGAANGYRCLAFGDYDGGRFVAVGDGGRVSTSGDGSDWTIGSGFSASVGLNEVTFGNGLFVAAAANGSSAYGRSSDGGATWTTGSLPKGIAGLAFGQGRFVAVGDGVVLDSSDGTSWSTTSVAGIGGHVAFGNGTFVAVDDGSGTFVSTDAVHWTAHANLPAGSHLMRVRFGGI